MKPIKLIISAFGPYAETMPEINFEDFNGRNLFLISGDTGSGKTTIFDAICFALYGKTSGNHRDENKMRSEYSDASKESFVEFHFSHQGANYIIKRNTSYVKSKKNGSGTTTVAEKVTFRKLNGDVEVESVDGLNPVKKRIEELLHIDVKQFKQIAMIAQGEFWELLNSKTDKRTEILRTIFQTDKYKDIVDKLKNRQEEKYGIQKNSEHSIVQYFCDIAAEEETKLEENLSDLKQKARDTGSSWNIDEMTNLIENILEFDHELLKENLTILKEEEKISDQYKNRLAIANTNNEFIFALEKLSKEHDELELLKEEMDDFSKLINKQKAATGKVYPKYDAWQRKSNEVKKQQGTIEATKSKVLTARTDLDYKSKINDEAKTHLEEAEKLKKQAGDIAGEEEKYIQRDQLLKSMEEMTLERERFKDKEKKLKEDEQKLKDKLKDLKDAVSRLDLKPSEYENVKSKGEKIDFLLSGIKDIFEKQVSERESKKVLSDNKQELYLEAQEKYRLSVEERIKAENIFDEGRLGILSKKLSEGERCPLCGSTHHPEPAKMPEKCISEEELASLRNTEAELQEVKTKAYGEAEKTKKSYEDFEGNMRVKILDCLDDSLLDSSKYNRDNTADSLDELLGILESARKEAEELAKENLKLSISLKKDCATLENSKADLSKTERFCENLQHELSETTLKLHGMETELANMEGSLNSLQNLTFKNWSEASLEKDNIIAVSEKMYKQIKDAEDDFSEAKINLAELESALGILEKGLVTQTLDEQRLKSELDRAVLDNGFESVEEMLGFVVSEDALKKGENRILEYRQSVALNDNALKTAKKNAEGKSIVDVAELTEQSKAQEICVSEIRKRSNLIENRINNNIDKLNNINHRRSEWEKARKDYTIANRLYKLVSGNTGNGKITLEQFVQATGFDGIISAANRRLLPMSDNQYYLRRQEGNLGRQSNTFLDLEVFDAYTGHGRPVGNLSGGESFKASLSLALGLSDTVSSNNGGIQMDALFIDEGFGTLDKKSMDSAIDTLMHLSGSNKLVGIISHREELVNSIYPQIKVEKRAGGSTFSVDMV